MSFAALLDKIDQRVIIANLSAFLSTNKVNVGNRLDFRGCNLIFHIGVGCDAKAAISPTRSELAPYREFLDWWPGGHVSVWPPGFVDDLMASAA